MAVFAGSSNCLFQWCKIVRIGPDIILVGYDEKEAKTRFEREENRRDNVRSRVYLQRVIHEGGRSIRTSATPLSKEEILSYFKEMRFNEQQEKHGLEFLLTPHEEEEAEGN